MQRQGNGFKFLITSQGILAKHQSRDRRINVEAARLAAEVSSNNEWCTIDRKTNFAYRSWGEPSHFSNAEKLIHGETFTQETFSPKKHFLHRETLFFYREKVLHTEVFTQGNFHIHNGSRKFASPKPDPGAKNKKKRFFFPLPLFTKNFKRENHQRQWRKKNLFMQPRQILLWNFDATIPPTAICIYFFARFFFAGRQATGLSGGHAAWGILLSPYPPAAANPEGYGGRAQTAALAIAWRAMEHTYPELGTGHCCRHLLHLRRSHQQQWLLLRPGNRCGGVNAMVQHFPERTARSALDSLKCIELSRTNS